VVATPHQLGRYNRFNSAAKIREAVEALSAELAESQIPLEIVPGGDVRIDPQVPSLLDRDEVLTVADRRRHLLLELPHELFVDPRSLLDSLLQRGIRPILTHPERYSYLHGSVDVVRSWVDRGAVIQITAGSLLGDFGSSVREMAIELVRQGLVELVATDAHDCERRTPRLSAAVKMLEASAGLEFARRVCLANPLAVFEGRDIGVEDSTES
jgi:protein-tyrosine phosphatase